MALINEFICIIRNDIFPSNTYLLKDGQSNDCIVFDPGLDENTIIRGIDQSGWSPIAIICTHGHFDHIGSVSILKHKFGIPYYLHEGDYKISQSANFYLKMAKIDAKVITEKPDHLLQGKKGDISIGNFELKFHHLPGHSDGSCIIQYKHYLFSGDTIFEHGIGDDSIPRANPALLHQSLETIIAEYNHLDLILPGHGNHAILGDIRQKNDALKIFLSKLKTNA